MWVKEAWERARRATDLADWTPSRPLGRRCVNRVLNAVFFFACMPWMAYRTFTLSFFLINILCYFHLFFLSPLYSIFLKYFYFQFLLFKPLSSFFHNLCSYKIPYMTSLAQYYLYKLTLVLFSIICGHVSTNVMICFYFYMCFSSFYSFLIVNN